MFCNMHKPYSDSIDINMGFCVLFPNYFHSNLENIQIVWFCSNQWTPNRYDQQQQNHTWTQKLYKNSFNVNEKCSRIYIVLKIENLHLKNTTSFPTVLVTICLSNSDVWNTWRSFYFIFPNMKLTKKIANNRNYFY